ncbi:MAG: hypothetical protein J7K35_08990 [Syntrophobacterales bacterium]|nr:hypothetical protein [Syntrophobacterales bacterium]
MRRKIFLILVIAMIFPLILSLRGMCDGESPIQITSDRLDAYDSKGIVLFSGNVVAVQKDTVIKSDELYLYYDKANDEGNAIPGITEGAGKIEKIELKGNVTMKRGGRTATGDMAVFYNTDQKIIITGNAVMMEGENVIKGGRVTVFLTENRGVVDGSAGERVTATIYPDDTK